MAHGLVIAKKMKKSLPMVPLKIMLKLALPILLKN